MDFIFSFSMSEDSYRFVKGYIKNQSGHIFDICSPLIYDKYRIHGMN